MDLNRATRAQILALKGIDAELADRILKHRPFERMKDLERLEGFDKVLVLKLRKQGARVERPRKALSLRVKADIQWPEDAGVDPVLYFFDEEDRPLGELDARKLKGGLKLPAELGERMITTFVAPRIELEEGASPGAERLRRTGFPERRALVDVDAGTVHLGGFTIDPRWLHRSCCRVRGRVFKTVELADGSRRQVPLCHARVQICEVDHSPIRILQALPDHLVLRLRKDLQAREVTLAAQTATELRFDAQLTLADDPRAQPRLADAATVFETRRFLLDNLELVAPLFCGLDWLGRRLQVDCLTSAPLDEDGCFDTHIHYWCYGDKPDLYFKVEQECHEGDWRTVYAPSVRCTTRWNYCCGEKVQIEVTDPRAAVGPLPERCVWPDGGADPSSVGEWDLLPYTSGVFTVHAALMRTGKVLLFSGGAESQLPLESRVWDPVTEAFTSQNFQDDLFCAHQVVLADGRVLVMGGSNYNGPHGRGIDASYTFNPGSENWTQHTDMNHGRWYPTAVHLPDGKVIVLSGRPASGPVVEEMEVFDPSTNAWSVLPASAEKSVPIYPSLHLMKGGKVVYTGCRWAGQTRTWASPPDTALFDPSTNAWTDIATHVIPNRTEGTSILLPPARAMSMEGHEHGEELPPPPSQQRVLVLGGEGGAPAERSSAEILDLAEESPAWRRIADMAFRRVNPNAVILPDRSVLVVGGVRKYKFDWDPEAVLEAELFDPTNETWRTVAAMSRGRHYHSVSILLPDGRVLTTGTTSQSGNDMSMEVYSPPYLFRGPRPQITGHPTSLQYGGMAEIETPDACRVTEVCLLRPCAATHHTDSEQRYVPLHIHGTHGCALTVMVPGDSTLLPPGYYLLFVLDECGVPSVGKFVRVV